MAKAKKAKKQSNFAQVFRQLRKNKIAMLGLIIFIAEVIIALIGPMIAPYDYAAMDIPNALAGPSAAHIMGTDDLGRDIFSRLLVGARYSLAMGLGATLFGTIGGVIIGSIAGYFGGRVDNIIMRFLDIIQAIPGMLLTIAIAAVLGTGVDKTILAMSIGGIAGCARMLRASMLSVRELEYIESAQAINCSKLRIIAQHLLPNSFSPMIVGMTMGTASTIVMAAGLSFVGLGVQPPSPEWGAMLSGGRAFIQDYPHLVIFPGLAIMITVLALNMFGDGLRDAMDPKLRN